MEWLRTLFTNQHGIATCLFVLSLVIASGLALGTIRIAGHRLGVAGILFSGLAFGHIGLSIDHTVLEFAREFGLILFVYAVGLSIGPGFFNAFRKHGLSLNLLAGGIVLLGFLLTLGISFGTGIALPISVGIFSGSTTNTPSLAAASQTLREHAIDVEKERIALRQAGIDPAPLGEDAEGLRNELVKLPGLGYAVTYPFGVIGIILVIATLRSVFKIDPVREAEELQAELAARRKTLERMHLKVTNANLAGLTVHKLLALGSPKVVVSRILHDGVLRVAHGDTVLAIGDTLLAVGPAEALEAFRIIVGEKCDADLVNVPGRIEYRWVVVSRTEIASEPLAELHLDQRFGVQITRVRRAGVELPPMSHLRLGLADQLLVVGEPEAVAAVAREVGDAPKHLEQPELIPVFVGIAIGIVLGSVPWIIPGTSAAVQLGLAGGPLLVAIFLARIQRLGPLAFYLPTSANMIVREMGIAIFLAAVGLKSGDRFVASLISGDGVWWMLTGAIVTVVPLVIVGFIGHLVMKVRYATLIGVLAGSMTDPPALAFANAQTESELPAIAYATVYPVAMILRIVSAQAIVLIWAG